MDSNYFVDLNHFNDLKMLFSCHFEVQKLKFEAIRRVCKRRTEYKWQVACSTVSHEKALHNYFIQKNMRGQRGTLPVMGLS